MIYDTLKLSKALRASFTPEQADTLAEVLDQGAGDSLVTKADLKEAFSALRTDMVRWSVGAIAFNFIGTITIMIAIAKLVK